jgi:glycosyltransferase involved in cell wall biosynthesis
MQPSLLTGMPHLLQTDLAGPDLNIETDKDLRPLVSIVLPAYNEAAILEENLTLLEQYLDTLAAHYRWQIIVVNDGSRDNTGTLADAFAQSHPRIDIIHHAVNQGLGQALKTGFAHCQGKYIITLDLDLSYDPRHIERLLDKIQATQAQIVVTSPYMSGGKVSNVPTLRLLLSVWANRFLSLAAKKDVATLTGMVRAYDAQFLKSLSFRAMGMDVNPEILYKARILKVRVVEVPAHLHWRTPLPQATKAQTPDRRPLATSTRPKQVQRQSSMKIARQSWSVVFYGFAFRPVMFFVLPGLLLLLSSFALQAHVLWHCVEAYQQLLQTAGFARPADAIAFAFNHNPHDFLLAGTSFIIAIQLLGLGVLAMQIKHYFEESFYLGTQMYRTMQSKDIAPR